MMSRGPGIRGALRQAMGQIDAKGEYELGDLVGSGGMGQVYSARHNSGLKVVVKRVHSTLVLDEDASVRLGDEARVLRKVSHPNVVRIVDHGIGTEGRPFLIMEHARGVTLRSLISLEGPLPLARIRGLARQLLDGLAAIHDAGVVHADIKSNNVLVDTAGGTDHLTIIDFGLARTSTSRDLFEDCVIAGTPGYMAPEVFGGEQTTAAADLYSAAIVIYEMIAGVRPGAPARGAPGVDPSAFSRTARARISNGLEAVVMRSLALAPERRYPSARSFAAAFDREIGSVIGDRSGPHPTASASPAASASPEPSCALAYTSDGAPVDPVIGAYLALADALIADDRMPGAVKELEGALLLLTPHGTEPPAGVWRIESLLATLLARLDNLIRARRIAMEAHARAVRSGCKLAEQCTSELMDRLMPKHATGPSPCPPRDQDGTIVVRRR